MKRKTVKLMLSLLLIVTLMLAPLSALAASKTMYLFKVSTEGNVGAYLRSSTDAGHLDPSADNVIATLKNGTNVVYWGSSNGQMAKVVTADGKTGYIYQGSLKAYGAMPSNRLYKTTQSAGVYRRSGKSYRKVGTVGANFPVIVYAVQGNVAYVRNLNGKAGYMMTDTLKKAL